MYNVKFELSIQQIFVGKNVSQFLQKY